MFVAWYLKCCSLTIFFSLPATPFSRQWHVSLAYFLQVSVFWLARPSLMTPYKIVMTHPQQSLFSYILLFPPPSYLLPSDIPRPYLCTRSLSICYHRNVSFVRARIFPFCSLLHPQCLTQCLPRHIVGAYIYVLKEWICREQHMSLEDGTVHFSFSVLEWMKY